MNPHSTFHLRPYPAVLAFVLGLGLGRVSAADTDVQAALAAHDRAVHLHDTWVRDPYIILGPDGWYYYTGTTQRSTQEQSAAARLNTGLGPTSLVGWRVHAWRSRNLVEWEDLGAIFSLKDGIWHQAQPGRFEQTPETQWRLWAPELHWLGERWALIHTSPAPVRGANLSLTSGQQLAGPWENPMGTNIAQRHDPSLFRDDDGTWWMIWGATEIVPLKPDFSALAAAPTRIGPSGEFSRMGHEGCLMRKVGGQYVLFGTGWSTGRMRKGSYNLYYAVADNIAGPYGERKFAGRFLGHGTPFQDKEKRWWCTAFYNANVPPVPKDGIESRDLSADAQTINEQGLTIVPMELRTSATGEVLVRARDARYAKPGPDEAQKF